MQANEMGTIVLKSIPRLYFPSTIRGNALIIPCYILVAMLCILLDIPVLRQILALPMLLVLPGLLILYLLKLDRCTTIEKIVLIVGMSAAFLMIFGVIFDVLLLELGYDKPLQTKTFVPAFSCALIVLTAAVYRVNRQALLSFAFPLRINAMGRQILLLPVMLPLLAIFGMRLLNNSDANGLVLIFLGLIPVSVILLTIFSRDITEDTYPIALLIIAGALLSMFALRSEHILGHDVHTEYYMFTQTTSSWHWHWNETSFLDYPRLNSCLSLTILPTAFQSMLDVSWSEYLFKFVYVLICSFSPLVVYIIAARYVRPVYAFLAGMFFSSQLVFIHAAGSPRTDIAIFFFALCIMVLFNRSIPESTRTVLFGIFMAALVVSHYSTTWVALAILVAVYLMGLAMKNHIPVRKISIEHILLAILLVVFWYGIVNKDVISSGSGFIQGAIDSFDQFFSPESRSSDVGELAGQGIASRSLLDNVHLIVVWATLICLAVGIIGTLVKREQLIMSHQSRGSVTPPIHSRLEIEFYFVIVSCAAILAAAVIIPYFSEGYGIQRSFAQMSVVVSLAFILGCLFLSGFRQELAPVLILVILTLYFVFSTGLMDTLVGTDNMDISSDGEGAEYEIVHDQEIAASGWLHDYGSEDQSDDVIILTPDEFGKRMLISQGDIHPVQIDSRVFILQRLMPPDVYVYLNRNNVVNQEVVGEDEVIYPISDYEYRYEEKDLVFTNGGSEVWR